MTLSEGRAPIRPPTRLDQVTLSRRLSVRTKLEIRRVDDSERPTRAARKKLITLLVKAFGGTWKILLS